MNWFQGAYPTPAEMRQELEQYLRASHGTKKHVARTRILLAKLWMETRKRPGSDAWIALSELSDASIQGMNLGASIKSAFRNRLLNLQDGRCCYCRRWLNNSAYARPIEHVLPRRHYPQFSIDFWNLAVACSDCNSLKTDSVWGEISTTRRRYPRPREFNKIFHPRFHRYEEHVKHIRVENGATAVVVFTGLTTQGKHLCHSLLHLIAAKETLIKGNPVMAKAMAEIDKFTPEMEGLSLDKFEKFQKTLEQSVLRFME